MTSQIIADNIDEDFPVADQDNDSQGFRDNFSAIKIAIATASSEISVLQSSTAKLGEEESNDFQGGIISNVQLNNAYKIRSAGTVTNNQVIVEDGDYFVVRKIDNAPIKIEWPDNESANYIEIILEVSAPDVNTSEVVVSFFGSVKANFINRYDPISSAPEDNIHLEPGETALFKCWLTSPNGDDAVPFVQFVDKFI
jgi:hypothetical protein